MEVADRTEGSCCGCTDIVVVMVVVYCNTVTAILLTCNVLHVSTVGVALVCDDGVVVQGKDKSAEAFVHYG